MILPGLALWPSRDMPLLLSRLLDYDAQVKTMREVQTVYRPGSIAKWGRRLFKAQKNWDTITLLDQTILSERSMKSLGRSK
jgi:hypothetical protein